MVNLAHLTKLAFPDAKLQPGGNVCIVDAGSGQKIAQWDEAALGPKPVWDAASQTYPALEQHRAAAESAAAAEQAERAANEAERIAIRAILLAMRNGTGTAGDRIARVERVLFLLAKTTLT